MASDDCMLDDVGAAQRGLVPFRNGYISLDDLMATAIKLQDNAMSAKMAGDHQCAVELYRELLPYVEILDELDAFKMPAGVSTQLVQRAIEIEEEHQSAPICST